MSEVNALTVSEQGRLGEMEAIVDRGLQTFYEVGKALTIIRDEQLYRVGYATFEDYCEEKWQMSRAYAYRTIGAADVVKSLSPIGDIPLPQNEAQARPLTSLEPEQRQEAWTKAVEESGGKPTARQVQQAADEVSGKVRNLAEGIQANVSESAYESVRSLQDAVLAYHKRVCVNWHDVIASLESLKADHKSVGWNPLSMGLVRDGKIFRVADLRQAVNNVLDGLRQQDVQRKMTSGELTEAVIEFAKTYTDEFGRTWADIENPSHTNGTFWQKITADFTRRGLVYNNQADLKFSIKQAYARMIAAASQENTCVGCGTLLDPDDEGGWCNSCVDEFEKPAVAVLNEEQTAPTPDFTDDDAPELGAKIEAITHPFPSDMMIATNSLRVNIESISVKIRQELAQEFRWWSDDDKRKLPGLQGDRRDVCYQRSILLVTIANMLDVN